jgi:DNA-directed RNA polymerase subunit RPC12/RpoP
MGCIRCGSSAVSERSERTAQGYRRFRCRTCSKQFNERSAGVLNRTQYPSDDKRSAVPTPVLTLPGVDGGGIVDLPDPWQQGM